MNRLLIIESIQSSEMDRAMVRLADWMGVERRVIANSSHSDFLEEFKLAARNGQVCIAASADTLAQIPDLSEIVRAISEYVAQGAMSILIYGLGSASSHASLLQSLGCRCIDGVHQIQKQPIRFRFSANEKTCLQQLAGLEFSDGASAACDVFEMAPSTRKEVEPLLFAEDCPVFVRTQAGRGNIEWYLWATNQIADVGTQASRETRPEDMYQWLLPAIIYLKACFGPRCWHNPNPRARLIIDDPLLHPQYGFLRYDALLQSMQRVPYGISLAFIPWNYRRSQQRVVDLFLANKDLLSLCVHGCDHTNHEFDSDDEEHLTQIAGLALERMRMHHERTGLLHEQVMVFPQGHFSSHALRALRTSGFVAAVNSSCYPSREEADLTLGDLLRPAVCRFHGFPIFLRRNPDRIIDIAVDLFLGKGGFIVEHHEFVRDGYGKWEQFAAAMNGLDDRLTWPSLDETITESCLQRVSGENRMDLHFFTRAFQWRNRTANALNVHLSKSEPEPLIIKGVYVNGQEQAYVVKDGWLHCDYLVKPEATISVMVLYEDSAEVLPCNPSFAHVIRVGMRRALSEFRDNHLSRHPQLLDHAKTIARHLRLTSDSHS